MYGQKTAQNSNAREQEGMRISGNRPFFESNWAKYKEPQPFVSYIYSTDIHLDATTGHTQGAQFPAL
jgi:hypothetical protein